MENNNLSLAELITGVMNHSDCPEELYNVMADALSSMASGPGATDTPAWVQLALDRQKEFDAIEALRESGRGH